MAPMKRYKSKKIDLQKHGSIGYILPQHTRLKKLSVHHMSEPWSALKEIGKTCKYAERLFPN